MRNYKLFSLALLATLTALCLAFAHYQTAAHWLLDVTAIIACLPLLYDMYDDLRHGTYGIDVLAITAIVSSVFLRQYWAGIVIVLMLTGGEALEDYAERRSKRELDALLSRAPAQAHVLRGKRVVDVTAADVQIGDRVVIKAGEVAPVDAVITEGSASFDESSLTGESVPVSKSADDTILSGSINLDGSITAKAVHAARDSQYEQIVRLVRTAQGSQAPFVRLADRYSIPFTLVAFAIAGGVWIYSGSAIRFLEVIVVATPCPLILAAPIAIISGMSRASKQGIIVRTGSALERLAKVKTIAFDKTGTLTQGRSVVDKVQTYAEASQDDILGLAAALEAGSTHVLAQAINHAAVEQKVKIPRIKHVREVAGRGLTAQVGGNRIVIGRLEFLQDQGVALPKKFDSAKFKQTATFVGRGGSLIGVITFRDELRSEASTTLQRLRALGIKQFMMITGDGKVAADKVASELAIADVTADALPADKLLAIERITDRPLAFVGDGVNDAPVLTAADVGIALGARGSTAASESADLVIMQDDLSHVAQAVSIAKRSFRIARQSILVGIALSFILMIVFATGKFQPIYGAAIQELVDVVVIINALRAHSGKN